MRILSIKKLKLLLRRSTLFASIFAVAVPFSLLSSFLNITPANADNNSTIDNQIVAYQFYENLFVNNTCGIKDTVSGSDINQYNLYNVYGTTGMYVGLLANSSGGSYDCSNHTGSNPDTAQFTKAAAKALGLDASNAGELLCQLGYSQTEASSSATETSCASSNIKVDGTDTFYLNNANTNVRKHLLSTVLKNNVPTWTNAMAYWSTLQDFIIGCGAQPTTSNSYGGTVANIKVVGSSGSITTQGYSYKTGAFGGKDFAAAGDIGESNGYYSDDQCTGLADALSGASSKYVTAYQSYVVTQACSAQYSDSAEQNACVAGAQNQSNINYCTNKYPGTANKAARLACYVGQGNQGEDTCVALGYTESTGLQACINGAQNASNSTYCQSEYPAPDAIDISTGKVVSDPNAANRAACLNGQKNPASGGLTVSSATATQTPPTAPTCGISGIGWIVCPVMTFIGALNNTLYGFVSQLLQTNPQIVSTSSDTYTAWGIMRTIANVAFVIVFLIIIFSQLTGAGVSNYGVKKMLPRLVIGAVLVNLSFYICQIAVDISNILGGTLYNTFNNITSLTSNTGGSDASGNAAGWTAIVAIILAAGVAAYLSLSILIPMAIVALVTILMIVLMLVGREALIIMLVVLAPLAFVAFLLPNTQSLFTRWRKLFTSLLMLYPIVAVVFGASKFASVVINNTAISTGGSQDLVQVIAIGAAVIPLIAVPFLLKGSLNGLGKVGGMISARGMKLGKSAGSKYANSDFNKFQTEKLGQKRAAVRAGAYEGKNPFRRIGSNINKRINTSKTIDEDGNKGGYLTGTFFNKVTGGYGEKRGKAASRLEGEEIAKKAEGLAGRVDPKTGLPPDPQELFESALKDQQKAYSNPDSTDAQKRDARIGLAAAQMHLTRTEGRAGAEYARERISETRNGADSSTSQQATGSSTIQAAKQAAATAAEGTKGVNPFSVSGSGIVNQNTAREQAEVAQKIAEEGTVGEGGAFAVGSDGTIRKPGDIPVKTVEIPHSSQNNNPSSPNFPASSDK